VHLGALALDDDWLACLDGVAERSGLALRPAQLATEVRALSDAYNTGAFERSRTKGALAARLMFSFPRDVPKMGAAVRELVFTKRLAIPDGRPLRVLDVGAGLGASSWGLVRMLAGVGYAGVVDATFVDDDPKALAVAGAIAGARKCDGSIELRVTAARERPRGRRFDVVLVGQTLAEIDDDEQIEDPPQAGRQPEGHSSVALLLDLLVSLETDGSLVIVEPALRDCTRRLHRVRDRLLVTKAATVFAPCLHQEACPALADRDAWCHEDLPIDLPKRTASLARAAGLRWQGLTFSYLVLRKDGVTLRDAVAEHAYRVVSEPIVTKGKRELFLCGYGARLRLTRLDRDGVKGDAWSRAQRGDVLSFADPPAANVTRVSADASAAIALALEAAHY